MTYLLPDLGWNDFFESGFNQLEQPNWVPGRIFMEQKSEYQVLCEQGENVAKLVGRLRHQAQSKSDLPVVGDWVALRLVPNGYSVIEAILPRSTQITRLSAGSRKRGNKPTGEEQVIGANVDTILIVTGLDRDYNIRRIERYLTMVYNSGATPVIVLNKADMCERIDDIRKEVETIAYGVPIHIISASLPVKLEELVAYLSPGKTLALLGSSGVGKSTIINNLLGNERQKIGEISDSVGKGQHTTTHRELILAPGGGLIMDNPGMREIVLMADEQDVGDAFADIEELADKCKFNDCRHLKEPGCAVKQAVESGDVDQHRLDSYHKMLREIQFLNNRKNMGSNKADKEKWRKLFKQEGKYK